MELCLINVNISIILSKIKLVLDSRMSNSTLYYQKEIINKYITNYNLNSKIFNNNNKFAPEFKVKSGASIIVELNDRIPEDIEIVSIFVNNIPIAK